MESASDLPSAPTPTPVHLSLTPTPLRYTTRQGKKHVHPSGKVQDLLLVQDLDIPICNCRKVKPVCCRCNNYPIFYVNLVGIFFINFCFRFSDLSFENEDRPRSVHFEERSGDSVTHEIVETPA